MHSYDTHLARCLLSQVEDAQKKAAADKEQRETARSAEASLLQKPSGTHDCLVLLAHAQGTICKVHVARKTYSLRFGAAADLLKLCKQMPAQELW